MAISENIIALNNILERIQAYEPEPEIVFELEATGEQIVPPTLTDPASAGQIVSGYQAIAQDGSILTGTIESQSGGTYNASTETQIIGQAGKYTQNNIVINPINAQLWTFTLKDGSTVEKYVVPDYEE